MGAGTEVDLLTLIIVVVMVCVATFSCTIMGRYCFDRYCRASRPKRRKICPHGGLPDLPCGICARIGTEMDFFSSSQWRYYHPSLFPNGAPQGLNYAALLAAERQNSYINGLVQHQGGSPGPTDILGTQRELPGPSHHHSSSISAPIGVCGGVPSTTEESGTFKRLGIRESFSGKNDINGIARQLENRNLSPIQQTPPDTHFPNDLSIAQSKRTPNSSCATSSQSSNIVKQRRANSFHQTSSYKQGSKNTYYINSSATKSSRTLHLPGIKKMFSRQVGASDLSKSPRSEGGAQSVAVKPSPIRKRIYQSPRIKSSPVLTKAKSATPAMESSLNTAPLSTTIDIESDKDVDEVDDMKTKGFICSPGNTIPIPLLSCEPRNLSITISDQEEEEEICRPLGRISKPPRLSTGGGSKIRTYRHRSLNDAGGLRQAMATDLNNNSTNSNPLQSSGGLTLKRFKSLEGGEHSSHNGLIPNYCSFCGQFLLEHGKNSSRPLGACSELEIDPKTKPSLFQTTENTDEAEKTSSNSLGSPGIKSIIDSLTVVSARNSVISLSKGFDDSPPQKQHVGYLNIPISEEARFSMELEKRPPPHVSDTMFHIPHEAAATLDRSEKNSRRKSFDVECSVRSMKSPVRILDSNKTKKDPSTDL